MFGIVDLINFGLFFLKRKNIRLDYETYENERTLLPSVFSYN